VNQQWWSMLRLRRARTILCIHRMSEQKTSLMAISGASCSSGPIAYAFEISGFMRKANREQAQAVAITSGTGAFSMVAPLLSTINEELGPDPDIVWVGYVYTLVLACTLTLIGRVSDIFGRRYALRRIHCHFFDADSGLDRYVIVGGQVLAMIGTIFASQAKSVPMLIGAQAIVSVGTATQIAFQFVMGELVPIGKRFFVMGTLFAWTIPTGGFGLTWGLYFQQNTSVGWRGCYYLLFALNTVSAILFWCFYYPPSFTELEHKKTKLQVIKEFDFVGLVLFSGGFFIFLMGLTWGGAVHPWTSASVLAPILVGAASLAAFIAWGQYTFYANSTEPNGLTSNRMESAAQSSLHAAISI
jgi:MFS family permease